MLKLLEPGLFGLVPANFSKRDWEHPFERDFPICENLEDFYLKL